MIDAVLALARAKSLRLTCAESCTGGMLAALLTERPGSSDVFDCGFVTYSNAAKIRLLGVSQDNLGSFGAVSEVVAQAMAQGALDRSNAHVSVAITGIAGPGGSEFKPEGRVCFAAIGPNALWSETVDFGPLGRDRVRMSARDHALAMIFRALSD